MKTVADGVAETIPVSTVCVAPVVETVVVSAPSPVTVDTVTVVDAVEVAGGVSGELTELTVSVAPTVSSVNDPVAFSATEASSTVVPLVVLPLEQEFELAVEEYEEPESDWIHGVHGIDWVADGFVYPLDACEECQTLLDWRHRMLGQHVT